MQGASISLISGFATAPACAPPPSPRPQTLELLEHPEGELTLMGGFGKKARPARPPLPSADACAPTMRAPATGTPLIARSHTTMPPPGLPAREGRVPPKGKR